MRTIYGCPEGSTLEDLPISYDDQEPCYERAEQVIDFLADRAADLLREAGAHDIWKTGGPANAMHQAGTCRMGNDPKSSVTNRYGQSQSTTCSPPTRACMSSPAASTPCSRSWPRATGSAATSCASGTAVAASSPEHLSPHAASTETAPRLPGSMHARMPKRSFSYVWYLRQPVTGRIAPVDPSCPFTAGTDRHFFFIKGLALQARLTGHRLIDGAAQTWSTCRNVPLTSAHTADRNNFAFTPTCAAYHRVSSVTRRRHKADGGTPAHTCQQRTQRSPFESHPNAHHTMPNVIHLRIILHMLYLAHFGLLS